MKRLNVDAGNLIIGTVFAAVLVACVMAPSSTLADEEGKIQLRREAGQRSYEEYEPQINISSASAWSSSSSQIDSRGRIRSKSAAAATATGNASAVSSANSRAGSSRAKNGQNPRSSTSWSSAQATGNVVLGVGYPSQNDRKSSNQASATTSVTKNGVHISRSAEATEAGRVTTLDVISRMDEISMRENSNGAIEVRVRDRRKNADGNVDEKVYLAASRAELMKQSPKLARRIKAYEKIAGEAKASVDTQNATASGLPRSGNSDAMPGDQDRNAEQVLKQLQEKALQQNAGNPRVQELISKMIQNIGQ